MQYRRLRHSLELPGRNITEALVVPERFTICGLALFSEVSAARLGTVERIERQSAAAAAPTVVQPFVQPTTAVAAKPVAKPVQRPTPDTKAKVAPKQTSTEMRPGMDIRGIANWTVLGVLDGTAALEGPRGIVEVAVGDTIPGLGRVQTITRSGRRWVVATTKGVITPQ